MFSSEQYRAKAAEYLELAAKTESPNEIREFGDLERSYSSTPPPGTGEAPAPP
jgi:hypothetical protein